MRKIHLVVPMDVPQGHIWMRKLHLVVPMDVPQGFDLYITKQMSLLAHHVRKASTRMNSGSIKNARNAHKDGSMIKYFKRNVRNAREGHTKTRKAKLHA